MKVFDSCRRPAGAWLAVMLGGSVVFVSPVLPAPQPGDFLTQGPTTGKQIALTFDDGPGPHTVDFLNLLDRYKVKATFFVMGGQARRYPQVLKDVADRGHEVANHTMTHMNYNKRYQYHLELGVGPEKAKALAHSDLLKDLQQSRDIIEKTSGKKIRLLRMPYGIDRPWISSAAKQAGFVLLNWTHGSDWNSASAEDLIPGYIKAIQPGAVLLIHDGWPKTEKSLAITEAVLQAAQEKGYSIVPAGDLIGLGK